MATWALRPVTPAGSSFGGQMVYNMTNVEVPNTFKRYVENVAIGYPAYYVNKFSGFESKKYRVKNTTGSTVGANVSIMLIGSLPRWLQQLLLSIARGCNGAGMEIDFYDDWVTGKQYTGLWINAGDFVDSSELLCGGSIDIEAFTVQDV